MPPVTSVVGPRVPDFHPPPMRFPVEVKVMENDPAMRISVSGRTLSIQGVANNRGIVASFAQFEVAGKKINIPLNGGMTGEKVLAELKKRLPAGHLIQGDASSFQVMRGLPNIGPAKPTTVMRINSHFAAARQPNSPGKGLMTVGELRSAFKAGLSTGGRLSAAEKEALAKNWASLFTGAGFLATPAAQAEYSKLQKKYDLPVFPVF